MQSKEATIINGQYHQMLEVLCATSILVNNQERDEICLILLGKYPIRVLCSLAKRIKKIIEAHGNTYHSPHFTFHKDWAYGEQIQITIRKRQETTK